VLKQDQYVPMPVEKQIAIIFAGTAGYLDDLPVDVIRRFEEEYLAFLETKYPEILKEIADKKHISDELRQRMSTAVEEFRTIFKVEG